MTLRLHPALVPTSVLVLAVAIAAGPLALPAASGAPAASPATTGDAAWSVAPADASGPDDRVSLRHELAPGEQVADHVAVTNQSASATMYSVVAGDGIVGANGAFDIRAGEAADAGGWITVDGLDAGAITLEAGETRVLPIEIAVPADATPGDHPAGIVVGVGSAEGDGVSVQTRVGVRLHLRVTGDVAAGLELEQVGASFTPSWNPFAPGTLTVDYRIGNTGNVRVGSADRVTATGPFAIAPTSGAAEPVHELLPTDEVRRTVTVEAWPTGLLTGAVDGTPLVVGDDDWQAETAAVRTEFTVVALAWWHALVVLLLGGVVTAIVIAARRRGRRGDRPTG